MNTAALLDFDFHTSAFHSIFIQPFFNIVRVTKLSVEDKLVIEIESEFKAINILLKDADLDGIKPVKAKEMMREGETLYAIMDSFIDDIDSSNEISIKSKHKLVPLLQKTNCHVLEILEALEIYSDKDAMKELELFHK